MSHTQKEYNLGDLAMVKETYSGATMQCALKGLVIAASSVLLVVVGLYWSQEKQGTLFCLCSCSACSDTISTYTKTDELWKHQIFLSS